MNRPDWSLTASHGDAWWAFHTAHPDVYAELRRMAIQFVARGHNQLGIGMLWETLRYHTLLGAQPGEETFRLNNNYRALYARLLMEREPMLRGVFTTRGEQVAA